MLPLSVIEKVWRCVHLFKTQYRNCKQLQRKQYRWKAETLKVCLLLVWIVYDQAFGRYRSLKGAEKWSRDHQQNWKCAYRHVEKLNDSKNAILFDLRRKITKLSRKNRFRPVASPGAIVAFSARHSSRMKHRSRILSYSFDLFYINIKDLHAGYAATRWRNILSNLPKT